MDQVQAQTVQHPSPSVDADVVAAERALRRGAIQEARRRLAGRRDAPALVLGGFASFREGEVAAAVAAFADATRVAPNDAIAHAYLALALVSIGEVPAAQTSLERALSLSSESFVVRLIQAQVAYRLGMYPTTVGLLERALSRGAPDVEAYEQAATLLRIARERARGSFVRPGGFVRLPRWPRWLTRPFGGRRLLAFGGILSGGD